MFKINEQVNCALYVNGTEMVLGTGSFMQSIHISVMAGTTLPILVFKLVDMFGVMVTLGLQDGSQVKVSFQGIVNIDRNFRVHSWSRSPAGEGFSYTLNCYWDAPQYMIGTTNVGINASSSEALTQIAQTCGLLVYKNNVKTADNMLWMPTNQTYGEFAKDIARHGYSTATSLLAYGIDSSGGMRYVDVNAIPDSGISVGFVATTSSTANFMVISDFQPDARSGTNNTIAGYMHSRYVQSANADAEAASLENQLQFNSDSAEPLYNQQVVALIKRSGISYSPIDFGNVHSKFERAKYQNTRFNLLNSLHGEFLFGYQTSFELFDNFKYTAPPAYNNTAYDGTYTVTGKIIFVAGVNYYEKIRAVKNGLEST